MTPCQNHEIADVECEDAATLRRRPEQWGFIISIGGYPLVGRPCDIVSAFNQGVLKDPDRGVGVEVKP